MFFVVDPIGLIPVFSSYLEPYTPGKRLYIIIKANLLAFLTSTLFILFGDYILDYLGILPESFILAGGILLFLISIDMLYERKKTTKSSNHKIVDIDEQNLEDDGDISVFPLAIPFLSGPGAIAALMMFVARTSGSWGEKFIILGVAGSVFAASTLIMSLSLLIIRLLGRTGLSIVHRLMGLILAGLSIQFILNGLTALGIIKATVHGL